MPTLYSPGSIPVAVTEHGFVALEAAAPAALAVRIHALAGEGRGLGGVIEALTDTYGASLTSIPAFAVALSDGDSVRVAVRGEFVLEVESGGAGPERVSGAGVTTWTERVIAHAGRVALTGRVETGLPVSDAVVLAGSLVWEPTGSVPDAAPAAPSRDERAAGDAPASTPASTPDRPEDRPSPVSPTPGLIDSSAVLTVATLDTLVPDDTTTHSDVEPPVADAYDPLAATVARPAAETDAAPAGDHDGATISLAQARALRGGGGDGLSISVPPLAPPRPRAPGRIRLSTGQVVALDRTVVIGRRPRSTRVSGTDLPHLIAVDSPQQDISRSHVELRVEGDSIVATDLRTTNGTTLVRPGADPVRLHPGEGTVVVPGDVLDLGDGITVAIEEHG